MWNFKIRYKTWRICFRLNYSTLVENKRPTWCHLLFYFTSYMLNIFRTLIYPSSGPCDCSVELPHWSYCSWFDQCGNSTEQSKGPDDGYINVRNMWAYKEWNKIESYIKLVFYSSTITMMHCPINIRLQHLIIVVWFFLISTTPKCMTHI